MAYKQSKNPFGKSPLNFSSPLNSFDSLVGKLMNQGKSKEAATKIAGKVANAKMKGAGSGPTAAQKARAKGSPAKQAKPDFLDLDKDGNTTEPMKDAAKSSPAKMKSPMKKHSDAHIKKEAKRIARKNKGDEQDIYYELKSKYAQEKKAAAKKAKDAAKGSPAKTEKPISEHFDGNKEMQAVHSRKSHHSRASSRYKGFDKNKSKEILKAAKPKDDTKGSPAKLAKKDTRPPKGYIRTKDGKLIKVPPKRGDRKVKPKGEGKATKVIQDRKKTADLLNAKNPPSAKTRLKKSGVKANSPANLKGVVKGAEKVAKIVKKAKPQQIARQAKLAAISGEAAIKGAMAGAAGYIAGKLGSDKRAKTGIISSKKKSPLNNAYENPEYFVPTKSSYGQDMDNFFNTVSSAYDKTQSPNFDLDNMTDKDINSLFDRIQEVRNKNKNKSNQS